RLQTVTSYPSCRSTAAQLSRRVCSSSTTRIRTRAFASGPIASRAAGSRPSLGWTPSCVIGMDIALVLDNGRPPAYAGFGPHCREPAARLVFPHGMGNNSWLRDRAPSPCAHQGASVFRGLVHRFAAWGLAVSAWRTVSDLPHVRGRHAVWRRDAARNPGRYVFNEHEPLTASTVRSPAGDGSSCAVGAQH